MRRSSRKFQNFAECVTSFATDCSYDFSASQSKRREDRWAPKLEDSLELNKTGTASVLITHMMFHAEWRFRRVIAFALSDRDAYGFATYYTLEWRQVSFSIETSQSCDTSRSGLVNLKVNGNPFKQKSLPQGQFHRLGGILTQNISCICSITNTSRDPEKLFADSRQRKKEKERKTS